MLNDPELLFLRKELSELNVQRQKLVKLRWWTTQWPAQCGNKTSGAEWNVFEYIHPRQGTLLFRWTDNTLSTKSKLLSTRMRTVPQVCCTCMVGYTWLGREQRHLCPLTLRSSCGPSTVLFFGKDRDHAVTSNTMVLHWGHRVKYPDYVIVFFSVALVYGYVSLLQRSPPEKQDLTRRRLKARFPYKAKHPAIGLSRIQQFLL